MLESRALPRAVLESEKDEHFEHFTRGDGMDYRKQIDRNITYNEELVTHVKKLKKIRYKRIQKSHGIIIKSAKINKNKVQFYLKHYSGNTLLFSFLSNILCFFLCRYRK